MLLEKHYRNTEKCERYELVLFEKHTSHELTHDEDKEEKKKKHWKKDATQQIDWE